MKGPEALATLRRMERPFFSTAEAARILNVSSESATQLLRRLAEENLVTNIRQGRWALSFKPYPLAYAGWVTSPLPSYVSLYTALHQHGLIEQIPSTIYVVSLAKSQSIDTKIGSYSVHQIAPPLFGGYVDAGGFLRATPEKALFDTLYLSRARSGQFAGLTEVELPKGFKPKEVLSWAKRIEDPAARTRVEAQIAQFLTRNF